MEHPTRPSSTAEVELRRDFATATTVKGGVEYRDIVDAKPGAATDADIVIRFSDVFLCEQDLPISRTRPLQKPDLRRCSPRIPGGSGSRLTLNYGLRWEGFWMSS